MGSNGSQVKNSDDILIQITSGTLVKEIAKEGSSPELHCSEGMRTRSSARLAQQRTAKQKASKIEHTGYLVLKGVIS